jgi:hypothetical protein
MLSRLRAAAIHGESFLVEYRALLCNYCAHTRLMSAVAITVTFVTIVNLRNRYIEHVRLPHRLRA